MQSIVAHKVDSVSTSLFDSYVHKDGRGARKRFLFVRHYDESIFNQCVIGQTDEILICSLRRAVNGAFFGRNAEFSAVSFGHRIRLTRLHDIHRESTDIPQFQFAFAPR